MKTICALALCLAVLGCGGHRDLVEYSLDAKSFDAKAMAKIERESGIDLPEGARGLAFLHLPPIDPIVFAKINVPAEARNTIIKRIDALTSSGDDFPKDFANDRCRWWPAAPNHIVRSKRAFSNGYYVELYLVAEREGLILYIKYFTI